MSYLKYSPAGTNLWAVFRGDLKIGEIAVSREDRQARLIPVESFCYTLPELESITGFMLTATGQATLGSLHREARMPVEVTNHEDKLRMPVRSIQFEDETERARR